MLPPVDLDPHRARRPLLAAALMCAAGLVLAAAPVAQARSAASQPSLDLRLQPSDVRPSPVPQLPEISAAPDVRAQNVPETVGEIDRVKPNVTPNRRDPGSGPLGNLGGDGSMLQELLENKTIPLFRVRVTPPF